MKKHLVPFSLIIIFFICLYIFTGNVLIADDIHFEFFPDGIKFYKELHYGTCVMEMQNILMYWIPYKLNINIQDWVSSFGALFKSFIIMSVIYLYFKFIRLEKDDIKITIPLLIIIFYTFFIYVKSAFIYEYTIMGGFFRFLLPVLFELIFIYEYYKLFTNRKFNKSILFLSAIISTLSSPITASVSIILVFISLIYKSVFIKDLNKTHIYILITIIASFTFLFFNHEFQNDIILKTQNNPIMIDKIFRDIPEFLALYSKEIIISRWIYYVPYIVLLLITLITKNDKTKSYFSLFLLISINAFMLSLVIMGKTEYMQRYWFYHSDLFSTLIPLYILSYIIVFMNYISTFSEKKINKITIFFIICIILIFPKFCDSADYTKKTIINIRNHSYIRDKIRMFYFYRNEPPIMPIFAEFHPFHCLLKMNKVINFGENGVTRQDIYKVSVFYNFLETAYYRYVYNITPSKQYFIKDDDKSALEIFIQNGGSIDEIYSGKYKFTNLNNKNFVLNNKKNNN